MSDRSPYPGSISYPTGSISGLVKSKQQLQCCIHRAVLAHQSNCCLVRKKYITGSIYRSWDRSPPPRQIDHPMLQIDRHLWIDPRPCGSIPSPCSRIDLLTAGSISCPKSSNFIFIKSSKRIRTEPKRNQINPNPIRYASKIPDLNPVHEKLSHCIRNISVRNFGCYTTFSNCIGTQSKPSI